jgi:hypothetical protein
MTNTKYLNAVLTTIAVLLALNFWAGIHHAPGVIPSLDNQAIAQGRVDAGQQRAEMIKELKGLKSTVESLSKKLSDGSITVKVEGDADND